MFWRFVLGEIKWFICVLFQFYSNCADNFDDISHCVVGQTELLERVHVGYL